MNAVERQGHNERFRQLEERHRNFIRKLCWMYARSDRELFLCLVQEVYVDLYTALPGLSGNATRTREAAWIFWRCRGVFSAYRRSLARGSAPLDESLANLLADDNSSSLVSDTIDDLSVCLNERQREILDRYRQGYSEEEIAAEFHIKPASVGKTLRRMAQKMKMYNEEIHNQS